MRTGASSVREYDPALGRVVRVRNAAGTERFGYEANGQLTSHVRELDGHRFETRYAYDPRGRLALKTLPDGQRLRHHYHEDGPNAGTLRAITRERRFGLGRETVLAEIDLEARDGASGHLAGNGLRTQRTYAPDGTLRTLDIENVLTAGYTFDAAGRIVAIEENGERQRYAYTGGRLSSATSAIGTYRYAYDAVGNRTERERVSADGGRHARAPELRRAGNGQPAARHHRCALGREPPPTATTRGGSPTQAGDRRYEYDAERRPVALHRDGTLVARYAYNAFGERVKKTVYSPEGHAPRVTYFLYDGSTLVAEADGEGSVTAHYVYLPDGHPVAKLEGREIYAIHTDHRGAPRLASDEAGRIVWRASYAPFGPGTGGARGDRAAAASAGAVRGTPRAARTTTTTATTTPRPGAT